ncbi:MAG: A/G-specific adenine glycosylase [Bryobacteraceae bacterium]
MRIASIRTALIAWYEGSRRDLPWRATRDPYAIWISEVMLQQTRAAAVVPYYERFLAAFPDAASLAEAREETVLAMWSGLGYYSRARNLQKASREIVAVGAFPHDYASIRQLPGVGDYTAAAVASIAFELPHAAIDGNVKRVISRLANDGRADVAKCADALLDRKDPGRWNQAMMELGATVCLPRSPRCEGCPVAWECGARRQGTQHELPLRRAKPTPVRLTRTLFIVQRGGRIALASSARVKGFWDLPEIQEDLEIGPVLGEFRHTITFRHYRFIVRRAALAHLPPAWRWFSMRKLDEIPLSTTAKKALRCLSKPERFGARPSLISCDP